MKGSVEAIEAEGLVKASRQSEGEAAWLNGVGWSVSVLAIWVERG